MVSTHLHALWGKTSSETGERHPLLWHLLDVAAVALDLWDTYAAQTFRERFCAAVEMSREEGGLWFAWLAAMHDLGKVSPYFQFQGGKWAERVTEVGLPLAISREISHEQIGAAHLMSFFLDHGATPRAAYQWASCTSIEHGYAPTQSTLNSVRKRLASHSRYVEHYDPLVSEVQTVVADVLGLTRQPTLTITPDVTMLNVAAGMIKTADWIASNERLFPYFDQDLAPEDYLARAMRRSAAMVASCNLHQWDVSAVIPSFEQQFGKPTPRSMQQTVIDQARDLPLASLMIVEAQMGQGKTEAALGAAMEFASKGATGLYFALPTQATARSIHGRVSKWLSATGLSRRGAILNTSDWRATQPGDDTLQGFDAPDFQGERSLQAATEQSKWFRGPHRALLSKVGVGTVDQVLLSAQPVRYGVSRWSGLAGRVVVFDEVHAYDSFMATVFCKALMWLGRLGCPVILLSATLPDHTRAAFVNAYRSGVVGDRLDEPLPQRTYPALTVATAAEVRVIEMGGAPAEVSVEHLPIEKDTASQAIAEAVRERVREERHGVVAVVCNSVPRAVEVAQALAGALPDAKVSLLHSRFAALHRAERTQEVLSRAGEAGLETRTKTLSIIVGTQVIEQSLDIDADWMLTEVAPVDLVLQRAGRLHRWKHTPRPSWGKTATLTLLEPALDDQSAPLLASVAYVYSKEAPKTLLSSWGVLRDVQTLSFPQDIPRLVCRVYDEHEVPTGLPGGVWEDAEATEAKVQRTSVGAGHELVLPDPWLPGAWSEQHLKHGDAAEEGSTGRFRSRLGEPSLTVALAHRIEGCLAPIIEDDAIKMTEVDTWRLSTVSVLAEYWPAGLLVSPAEWKTGAMQGVQILDLSSAAAQETFAYSPREGLIKIPKLLRE